MTETTRRNGGMDALACQVTLYRRDTYLAVKFILKNIRTETITVDYRQTVPDDLTSSHLSFTSEYMGDAWAFEDARLEFSAEIDGGEQIETVYGIKHVDIPALVDFIRYATIVVTQDGRTVETVTEIEPDIEGRRDATSSTESTDGETSDRSASDEPSSETSEVGDSTETVEEARSDELSEPDETQPSAETRNEGQSVVNESASSAKASGQGQSNGAMASPPESGVKEEGLGDGSSTAQSRAEEEHSDSVEWETLTAEEDTSGATDEQDATTAVDSHVPFVTEGADHEPEGQDDRPPALPANRSDYILEDVRGEIESPAEFEWVDLADDANDSGDASDSGVLGWIRSHLPL
jgi:hypothetical protein